MTTTISISLYQAARDFLNFKRAQYLSERTLLDYQCILDKFTACLGSNRPMSEISAKEIAHYLASLKVSKKRARNIYITLSSMWTWAIEHGICSEHVVHQIRPPKPERRVIVPLERNEVEALLASLDKSMEYTRPGKRPCRNKLSEISTLRDRAILLFLLDTGARASELCGVRVKDIGLFGVQLFGKGAKERIVPISGVTRAAIETYLSARKARPDDYVFVTIHGQPLTRDSLRQITERIARRAGITRANPHRFRHTFAINFLRNGGDAFTLQAILGHETLEMVKRYLAIARSDIQRVHAKASPVANWHL